MSEPTPTTAPAEPNPFLLGMTRGMKRRCPNCGQGRLYVGYLKVDRTCAVCGNDNAQYRADDAGPYFTILIVGHIVIGPMLFSPWIWKAPVGLVLGVTMPLLAGLTLALLPTVKGAVIGVQWALANRKAALSSPPPPRA